MEPVKGGKLVQIPDVAREIFAGGGDQTCLPQVLRSVMSLRYVLSSRWRTTLPKWKTLFLCPEKRRSCMRRVNEVFDKTKPIAVDSEHPAICTYIALYNNIKMFEIHEGWQDILYWNLASRYVSAFALVGKGSGGSGDQGSAEACRQKVWIKAHQQHRGCCSFLQQPLTVLAILFASIKRQ